MSARTVVVTGGAGRIASALVPVLRQRGWRVCAYGRPELDVRDQELVARRLAAIRPTVVVNLAAWTDVDACELDEGRAFEVNAAGVRKVREAAEEVGAHLLHVSTDYVFGGGLGRAYHEDDAPDPINAYGRTKLEGELEAGPDATVARLSWVSGTVGRSLVRAAVEAIGDPGSGLTFAADRWGSPSVASDVVDALAMMVERRPSGIYHVANLGAVTPYQLAIETALRLGADPARITSAVEDQGDQQGRARRPRWSALAADRIEVELGLPMRRWDTALADLLAQLRVLDRG